MTEIGVTTMTSAKNNAADLKKQSLAIFNRINPQRCLDEALALDKEYVDFALNKKKDKSIISSFKEMLDYTNVTVEATKAYLTEDTTPKGQKARLEYNIKLMNECLKIADYNTAMAIYQAINTLPAKTLTTLAPEGSDIKKKLDEFYNKYIFNYAAISKTEAVKPTWGGNVVPIVAYLNQDVARLCANLDNPEEATNELTELLNLKSANLFTLRVQDKLSQKLCDLLRNPHDDHNFMINEVHRLIRSGANPNYREKGTGNTPLHIAVGVSGDLSKQDPELIKVLIEQGADLNMQNSMGRTSLHIAAQNYDRKMYQFLKDAGALDSVEDFAPALEGSWPQTPKNIINSNKNRVLVELQHNLTTSDPVNPKVGDWKSTLQKLSEIVPKNPADFKDYSGLSPLHHAAKLGNVEMINALIEKGAKVNFAPDTSHNTTVSGLPLHYAIAFKKPEAVYALLEAGADPLKKMPHDTIMKGSLLPTPLEFVNYLEKLDPSMAEMAKMVRDKVQAQDKLQETSDLENVPPAWLTEPATWFYHAMINNEAVSVHFKKLSLLEDIKSIKSTLMDSMKGNDDYIAWVENLDSQDQNRLSTFGEGFITVLGKIEPEIGPDAPTKFYDAVRFLDTHSTYMTNLLTKNAELRNYLTDNMPLLKDTHNAYQESLSVKNEKRPLIQEQKLKRVDAEKSIKTKQKKQALKEQPVEQQETQKQSKKRVSLIHDQNLKGNVRNKINMYEEKSKNIKELTENKKPQKPKGS